MALSDTEAMVVDTESPKDSTLFTSDAEKTDKTPDQAMADEDYPQGLKLYILAASSLVAVFLIALDQVRLLILSNYIF